MTTKHARNANPVKKKRKPRGVKQNGYPSYDLCEYCLAPDCNPLYNSCEFEEKIQRRLKAGVCPACGHKPCRCKSSLKIK